MDLFEIITLITCFLAMGIFKHTKSIIPTNRQPEIYFNLLFIYLTLINGYIFTFIILFNNFKWYVALLCWFLNLVITVDTVCPKIVIFGEIISNKIQLWGKNVTLSELYIFGNKIDSKKARFIKISIVLAPTIINLLATLLFLIYLFRK